MDKTKSKLAAFFDNDEEEPPFPQKIVDDAKLSQYTAGKVRKSRREKEQEAVEAKKREEEANAARAYAEFLDAFEGEDAGRRKAGSGFVKASTESTTAYALNAKPPERQGTFQGFRGSNRSPSPSTASTKPKGKRAMDSFLEEIKRDQAEREARYSRHAHGPGRSVTALAAYDGQSGSKDRGDPQTSNVFVANLPPHVTEQALGNFFARVGPVGSVKVMWPRTDTAAGSGADTITSRRLKNAGLSGFVSFMKRKDAENALREFDGFDWGGSILRVGWSKAVPIAAKPLYVAQAAKKPSVSSSRSRSRSWDRRRSHSPIRPDHHQDRGSSRDRNRSRSPRRRGGFTESNNYSPHRRRSRSPHDRAHAEEEGVTDTFIRAVAAEVIGHGAKYEESLREHERGNPKFAFLLHKDHRRHAYYRGLIESEKSLEPEFDDEGYNSVYSTDSAEESERERIRKTVLGRLARRRFESMLRALSGKRGELARCMAFSLEHAEAAHEVADIIVASLLVDGTAVPRKVARLHLICDILHNSAASVPSAWKFRLEFQSRLGIVFDHLANIYHSFPGRITAETFKKQITAIVDIWEDWIVFPPDFTVELRARLEGNSKGTETKGVDIAETTPFTTEEYISKFKPSSFQLAIPDNEGNVDENEPMDVNSDVDGEAVDDDLDGDPVDVGSDLIDDVDGEPLRDDLDGHPLANEDLDILPMDNHMIVS